MRKIVSTVLCLSLLLSGFSWAGDLHVEAVTGQHHAISSDSGSSPEGASDACDHCCHGTAHQLGLVFLAGSDFVVAANRALRPTLVIPPSQVFEPPFRPPISI